MTDKATFPLTSLARTPADISLLLSDIPAASMSFKRAPDEFSVVEHVCHMRDIEIEAYVVRVRRILNEENPFLADIDGSRLAIERDYNRQSVIDATSAFTSARLQNLTLLNAATGDDFERTAELEGSGNITLGKLVEMMIDHDEGHLDELKTLSHFLKTHS
jgi:hypothetical protein